MAEVTVSFGPKVTFEDWLRDQSQYGSHHSPSAYVVVGQELISRFNDLNRRLSVVEGSPPSYTQDDLPLAQLLDAERKRSAALEAQLSGSGFMARTTQEQNNTLRERIAELERQLADSPSTQHLIECLSSVPCEDFSEGPFTSPLNWIRDFLPDILKQLAERPDPAKSDMKSWNKEVILEYALGLQRTLSEKCIALHNTETALNTLKALREEDVREFQGIETDAELGRLVRAMPVDMAIGKVPSGVCTVFNLGSQSSQIWEATHEEALRAAGVSVPTDEAEISPGRGGVVCHQEWFDRRRNEEHKANQEMTKCLACYGWSNKSGCLACKGTGWIVKEEACQ